MDSSLQTGSRAQERTKADIAGDFKPKPLRNGLFCLHLDKGQVEETGYFDGFFVANGLEGPKKDENRHRKRFQSKPFRLHLERGKLREHMCFSLGWIRDCKRVGRQELKTQPTPFKPKRFADVVQSPESCKHNLLMDFWSQAGLKPAKRKSIQASEARYFQSKRLPNGECLPVFGGSETRATSTGPFSKNRSCKGFDWNSQARGARK